MKTMLATLAAVGALTTAAIPAAAQPYGYDRYDRYDHDYVTPHDPYGRHTYDGYWRGRDNYRTGIDRRQARADYRIEAGARRGLLSPREVRQLRHDAYDIRRLEQAYRADGHLSRGERAELNRRLDWLDLRITGRLQNREYGYGY